MDIGWPEIVLILLVVVLIFGAGKLPTMARDLGKSVREFRKAAKGELPDEETETTKPEAKAETK